jgi:hypothetical protein
MFALSTMCRREHGIYSTGGEGVEVLTSPHKYRGCVLQKHAVRDVQKLTFVLVTQGRVRGHNYVNGKGNKCVSLQDTFSLNESLRNTKNARIPFLVGLFQLSS